MSSSARPPLGGLGLCFLWRFGAWTPQCSSSWLATHLQIWGPTITGTVMVWFQDDTRNDRIMWYIYISCPIVFICLGKSQYFTHLTIPYPPTPADARGSAPGNKTFDPCFGLLPLLFYRVELHIASRQQPAAIVASRQQSAASSQRQ